MKSVSFTLAVFVGLSLFGCGAGLPVTVGGLSAGSSGTTLDLTDLNAVQAKALDILNTNCVSCHVGQLDSLANAEASGYLVPGSPSTSDLYTQASSGLMPQGGSPLTASDLSVLQAWISLL